MYSRLFGRGFSVHSGVSLIFDLHLTPFFQMQSNENDKEQTGLALRAKASTYFVLNARSGLLKGEIDPGVGALGEEWDFLEVELGDLGLGDPIPCAYLVMASLSRRRARVPHTRARHLLDVPIADGANHESWLGQVLAKARESMETRLVLDIATTVCYEKNKKEEVIVISPPLFLYPGVGPS